jgi:hypothetical protein
MVILHALYLYAAYSLFPPTGPFPSRTVLFDIALLIGPVGGLPPDVYPFYIRPVKLQIEPDILLYPVSRIRTFRGPKPRDI